MKIEATTWQEGHGVFHGAKEVRLLAASRDEAKVLGELLALIYCRRTWGPHYIAQSIANATDDGYAIRGPEILDWDGRCGDCGAQLPADRRWLYCIMCGGARP